MAGSHHASKQSLPLRLRSLYPRETSGQEGKSLRLQSAASDQEQNAPYVFDSENKFCSPNFGTVPLERMGHEEFSRRGEGNDE